MLRRKITPGIGWSLSDERVSVAQAREALVEARLKGFSLFRLINP